MEPCEIPFITCDNKELGTEQLFRMLLALVDGDKPAIRTCVSNGGSIGGPRFSHQIATVAGQTDWVLPNPVRSEVGWVRNGSFKHENAGSVVGSTTVTTPPQPIGLEITFIY